jgi:uncharacterized membrane protein (UPF0182 family)
MTFEAIFSFWIIFEFQNKIYFSVDIIKRPRLAVELKKPFMGVMGAWLSQSQWSRVFQFVQGHS